MGEAELTLVTGASGFVGGHLVARMVSEGRRVRCLVRPSSHVTRLHALCGEDDRGGAELVFGDLTDPDSLSRAVAGCAEVVHAAAMVSDWGTVQEIRAANVMGTRALAAAAAASGVRR